MLRKIKCRIRNILAKSGIVSPPADSMTDDFVGSFNESSNQIIKKALNSSEPKLICRFGSVELAAIINYLFIEYNKESPVREFFRFAFCKTPYSDEWDSEVLHALKHNAGFFPIDNPTFPNEFAKLYLDIFGQIDVLGSWRQHEKWIQGRLEKAQKVRLADLEPHRHEDPWISVLQNKRVLVVHPFSKSIEQQYSKRDKIFPERPELLPEFDLQTLKSPQTLAGNCYGYASWFDALEEMRRKISQLSFDVAIVGCGAYGMPVAAYIKSLGKKALQLGGHTQFLFGIKGRRWEEHPSFNKYINNDWIKPLPEEIPPMHKTVEGGCYW